MFSKFVGFEYLNEVNEPLSLHNVSRSTKKLKLDFLNIFKKSFNILKTKELLQEYKNKIDKHKYK